MNIIRLFFWVVSPVIIVIYGWELVLVMLSFPESPNLQVAFKGFAIGCVFWPAIYDRIAVWQNLEHELTHSLMALLFLRPVESLAVHPSGGQVTYEGTGTNFAIVLAPYWLPSLSVTWLGLFPLIRPELLELYLGILGLLMAYDIVSNFREYHLAQPDIRECGAAFSAVFCTAATIIAFGLICAAIAGGLFGAGCFIRGYDDITLLQHVLTDAAHSLAGY